MMAYRYLAFYRDTAADQTYYLTFDQVGFVWTLKKSEAFRFDDPYDALNTIPKFSDAFPHGLVRVYES